VCGGDLYFVCLLCEHYLHVDRSKGALHQRGSLGIWLACLVGVHACIDSQDGLHYALERSRDRLWRARNGSK